MMPAVVIAVVLIVLAIPMILGIVPPNGLYGFRTPKTMSSPDIWYPANRVSGIYMAAAGAAILLVLAILRDTDWSPERSHAVMLTLVTAPVAIAVLLSFLHLRKL